MKVLLLGQPLTEPFSFLQGVLTPFGFATVDSFNNTSGTPTLAYLQGYDAVMVWTNSVFLNSTAVGDNLADYIDGGGGVVTHIFTENSTGGYFIAGRFLSGGYSPMNFNGTLVNSLLPMNTVLLPGHPIMTGYTTMSAKSRSTSTLRSGATEIARWSDGLTAAAVNPAGTVAHFNFFPNSSNVSILDGDFGLLISNALRFVAAN